MSFGNQVDVKEAKVLLQCCRDHGINFFDNAEVYASGRAEEIMGQAIREMGWKRSELVISTKIFWGGMGPNDKGLSRKHIVEGVKASLKRLDMEYLDVVYCHRADPSTPIEETVRAMNFVIEKGWALYWGTSEWSAQQITEAWGIALRLDLIGPVVEQPEYNLLSRQKVIFSFSHSDSRIVDLRKELVFEIPFFLCRLSLSILPCTITMASVSQHGVH